MPLRIDDIASKLDQVKKFEKKPPTMNWSNKY